jgi:hypothetical protein
MALEKKNKCFSNGFKEDFFQISDLSDGLGAGGHDDEDDDGRDAEAEGQLAVEVAEVLEADRGFRDFGAVDDDLVVSGGVLSKKKDFVKMLLRTTMLVLKLYVNMYRGVGSAV